MYLDVLNNDLDVLNNDLDDFNRVYLTQTNKGLFCEKKIKDDYSRVDCGWCYWSTKLQEDRSAKAEGEY